jgi:uncharacterized protein (UPF0128 family)
MKEERKMKCKNLKHTLILFILDSSLIYFVGHLNERRNGKKKKSGLLVVNLTPYGSIPVPKIGS